ncbi:DUF4268 domain-containing protein [uncultured Pontibacter sp.]|uniref:DUF4268 domain-containing protein n=1 Tax=uncultured Pontibacter sp. TaxID=453356 RepID=UPI00262FA79E|nr:DUF4268 domain-containing protein [uncultured Pontibacter sp.]
MYSREQASQLRQAFWTAFGQYIAPHLSSDGERINWSNYKTGLKHVYFRMQAEKKSAFIGIEITHPDIAIQELFFEQFTELKNLLHEYLGEEWVWAPLTTNSEGRTVSRIYKDLPDVSVFNKDDWPALISFFKPRIIALDDFWSGAKYSFDDLRE